jgi:hypothetical protein
MLTQCTNIIDMTKEILAWWNHTPFWNHNAYRNENVYDIPAIIAEAIARRDTDWHEVIMPLVDTETWERIRVAMFTLDTPKL